MFLTVLNEEARGTRSGIEHYVMVIELQEGVMVDMYIIYRYIKKNCGTVRHMINAESYDSHITSQRSDGRRNEWIGMPPLRGGHNGRCIQW